MSTFSSHLPQITHNKQIMGFHHMLFAIVLSILSAGCNISENANVLTPVTADSSTSAITTNELEVPTSQLEEEANTSIAQQFYTSEEFNFQFSVPDGYLIRESEHPDALLVISLHEESVMADERIHKPEIFVTIHRNEENLNVQEWFDAHTAETLSDMYPVYIGPRNLFVWNIAGRDALSFEDMTFSHAYVTLIQGESYVMALGYVPFDFPGLSEDYERLLNTLAFRE